MPAPTPVQSAPASSSLPDWVTRRSFMSHLQALRDTLAGIAIAWGLGMAVVGAHFDAVMQLLRTPLLATPGVQLITLSPLAALFIAFNIVTTGGLIVAGPLIILYALRFLLPALKPDERRIGSSVSLLAVILFVAGAWLGFSWILPLSLQIALGIQQAMDFQLLWAAQDYFSLVVLLPLVMGSALCLPLVVGVLVRLGVIPYSLLAANWHIAGVAILVLAAAITPTGDPITFIFIALPLAVLYYLAVWVGRPRIQYT